LSQFIMICVHVKDADILLLLWMLCAGHYWGRLVCNAPTKHRSHVCGNEMAMKTIIQW